MGMAVISALLSLSEYFWQTNTSFVQKYYDVCIANCFRNKKPSSVKSNFREWTHVSVNKPCSHLHEFCAIWASSGLATRLTLTRLLRGIVYYMGMNLLLVLFLYRSTWFLLGCVLYSTFYTSRRGPALNVIRILDALVIVKLRVYPPLDSCPIKWNKANEIMQRVILFPLHTRY
jgi:hypothetical protein